MRINLPLWLVRLTLGISFFLHGWGKFPYPPEKFAAWLESIGMVAPMTIATLVAVGEMAAGIGIIIGKTIKVPRSIPLERRKLLKIVMWWL